MTPVARYALIAAVALMSAAAGWQFNRHTAPTAKPQIAPGASAALMALALPDPDGTTQAIEQWRGKVLILNFWATWCPPCLREIPDFAKVSRTFADAPVQFVGISIDSADKVRAFADEYAVPYPLLIGSLDTLDLAAPLGNSAQALPFTVMIDRSGNIQHIKLGTLNAAELEGKIRTLLAM